MVTENLALHPRRVAGKRKWKRSVKPQQDHLLHKVLNALAQQGIKPSEVSKRSFLAASTIRKWQLGYENGGTRYPQGVTLQAAANVAGFTLELVRIKK